MRGAATTTALSTLNSNPLSTINSQLSTLLIKPGSLGDVVHALPVVAALHRAWPDSRLTWVIDPRWEPILAGNPAVAERLPFDRQSYRGPAGLLRAARWLVRQRHRRPHLAIDLQGLLRSALIAKSTRPAYLLGLADAREGATSFYDQAAPVAPTQHAVDRYLAILPLLGLEIPKTPEFWLPREESPVTRDHPPAPNHPSQATSSQSPVPSPASPAPDHQSPIPNHLPSPLPPQATLLHPYARGAGKSLTAAHILGLCARLAPTPVILVGMGTAPPGLPPNVTDLTNRTTLRELLALLRHARSVISVDSGPMHLAAAVGARLLSLHTWSDPRKVGPYPSAVTAVTATDAAAATRAMPWIWQGGELVPQDLHRPPRPEQPLRAQHLDAIASWAR